MKNIILLSSILGFISILSASVLHWETSHLVVDSYDTSDDVTGSFSVKKYPLPTFAGVVQGAKLEHMLSPIQVPKKLLSDSASSSAKENINRASCAVKKKAEFIFVENLGDDVLNKLVLDLTKCRQMLELGNSDMSSAELVALFNADQRSQDFVKAIKRATDNNFPQLRSLTMKFYGSNVYD